MTLMTEHERDLPLFSFVILADTHITYENGSTVDQLTSRTVSAKFDALLDKVDELAPDFIIHLGDVSHPSPLSDDYGEAARTFFEQTARIGVPWHLAPGNHDVGEKLHKALPNLDPEISITERNIAQFQEHYGAQFHSFEHKGCAFFVVNAMLFNSGLPSEQAQWIWLEAELAKNAGKRLFLCSHYPLFLCDENEPEHYDNIGQPARTRLTNLMRSHKVEACYSGHVHNFFYNRIDDTHLVTLPSTSIMRHDYLELFRSPPENREMGRYHPAKSGFLWVDVYPDSHVPHVIRQNAPDTRHTHSWRPKGPMPVMDLRMPWCDRQEVASPWGAEIFERKRVRNDYPLSALWEMGIRDLRIPVSDLEDVDTSKRVRDLVALGHRCTVVMFGLPKAERRAVLEANCDIVDSLEVVALQNVMEEMADALSELRKTFGKPIFLNPVHAEVQGYTSAHGIRLDCPLDIEWLDRVSYLCQTVDGFVVGVGQDVDPIEGFDLAQNIFEPRNKSFALHIQNVGMYRTTVPTSTVARNRELNRVAEAVILARLHPEMSVILDNFVELDRGYFHCFGLVDRTYNPQAGSYLMTRLDASLPSSFAQVLPYAMNGSRIIKMTTDDGSWSLLLLPEADVKKGQVADVLPTETVTTFGESLDLVTGATEQGTLEDFISGNHWPLINPTLFFAAEGSDTAATLISAAGR